MKPDFRLCNSLLPPSVSSTSFDREERLRRLVKELQRTKIDLADVNEFLDTKKGVRSGKLKSQILFRSRKIL